MLCKILQYVYRVPHIKFCYVGYYNMYKGCHTWIVHFLWKVENNLNCNNKVSTKMIPSLFRLSNVSNKSSGILPLKQIFIFLIFNFIFKDLDIKDLVSLSIFGYKTLITTSNYYNYVNIFL